MPLNAKIQIWKNRSRKYTVRTEPGIIELTQKELAELLEVIKELLTEFYNRK